MFVFGTQYLRGASPSEDQWEKDMENMKRCGFNTIRAWLVWNALEREEGKVDTAFLRRFLQCAGRHGLQVGLLFHLHACPAWAIEKYPQYFYVNENGDSFEPAVRPNTPGGGWPGLCFDHDEVRAMEERFIRSVIAETRNHDNVAFYEPMNEPHQWIDYTKSPAGTYCYCPASIAKFRLWLKEKYGSIEKLNDAWGRFYASFDEVRPPRWTTSYADYADFRLFTMDNVAQEIRWRSDIIRSCDCKPVIAHAWGGGAVGCANLGGMAFDDWKNAAIFDKWGYSAFPQKGEDCVNLSMGCAATRCAAQGKEYWQSELTAGLVGTGLQQRGRIDDLTFDKFSLESICQGARGLLYWQYRKERFGQELGGFALTDYAGGPTNLLRRASSLCRVLNENEDIFCHSHVPKAQVALIFSIRSYLADWCSSKRVSNKFCVDSLSGYYRMFWEENIPADILHEDHPGDLSGYRVVILPSAHAISPEFAGKLKAYIQNGGTVISDPYFGVFDECFRLSYQVPGFGFDEVFGARQDDITMEETVRLDGLVLRDNVQKETYRDVTARALYRYPDGSPAILSNPYGRGRAVLSGVNLGVTYSRKRLVSDDIETDDAQARGDASKKIVLDLCRQAGVRENPCDTPGVKVSLLSADAGTAVILTNHSDAEVRAVTGLEKPFSSARTVYGLCPCELRGSHLNFQLAPNASAIVRLE